MNKEDVVHTHTHAHTHTCTRTHTHTQEYYTGMKRKKAVSFVETVLPFNYKIILQENK